MVDFNQKKQNGTRSKCERVCRFILKCCLGICSIVSMFKQVVLELLKIIVW